MYNELESLKRIAAKLYKQAQDFDQFSCGRQLSEYLNPSIGLAREDFNRIWERIKKLDPSAPKNPFEN